MMIPTLSPHNGPRMISIYTRPHLLLTATELQCIMKTGDILLASNLQFLPGNLLTNWPGNLSRNLPRKLADFVNFAWNWPPQTQNWAILATPSQIMAQLIGPKAEISRPSIFVAPSRILAKVGRHKAKICAQDGEPPPHHKTHCRNLNLWTG